MVSVGPASAPQMPGQAVTSIGRPATDAVARAKGQAQGPPRLLTMHLLSIKNLRVRVGQLAVGGIPIQGDSQRETFHYRVLWKPRFWRHSEERCIPYCIGVGFSVL